MGQNHMPSIWCWLEARLRRNCWVFAMMRRGEAWVPAGAMRSLFSGMQLGRRKASCHFFGQLLGGQRYYHLRRPRGGDHSVGAVDW